MKAPFRPMVITSVLVAVFFVLLSARSGYASFRKFHQFATLSSFVGAICSDGISIGFGNDFEANGSLREIRVYRKGEQEPFLRTRLPTQWVEVSPIAPFTPTTPSVFCQSYAAAIDTSVFTGQPIKLCSGLHFAKWPEPLPAGTDVEISVFKSTNGENWVNMANCGENHDNESCRAFFETVSACRLGTPWVSLLQSAPLSTTSVISDSLVFELLTADPAMPIVDNGSGIHSVAMSVLGPDGDPIYTATDDAPPYCLFGVTQDGVCSEWQFSHHNYTWPSGRPLASGTHHLFATIDTEYGEDDTAVDWQIDVQRTYWQERRYLPYIEARVSFPTSAQR